VDAAEGQFTDGELPLDAAKREFEEEMGSKPAGTSSRSARSSSQRQESFTPGPPSRISSVTREEQSVLDGVAAEVRDGGVPEVDRAAGFRSRKRGTKY
jgi:predicted NUDIX family NTP pyrophosphohydrolase